MLELDMYEVNESILYKVYIHTTKTEGKIRKGA